ncbi:hypothetical protein PGT21_027793 [Puccinia graminis f. sp. tritici]|uniref:Protein kinase domain-containing protein n=1 Tax=Puccinia graminis f. sp. tritici TaxID=56615 RepID=A0A5B0MWS7_PUCGR|nr:hypothetical protein PGT21_027793 [Puccinia graminis f. sp. tritici]KAA1131177.1 hypothetical protein PGTUg99_021458 [Puccinia graminis f. sp. tritici]
MMRDQAHPQVILTAPVDLEHLIWLITELCSSGELFDYLVKKTRFTEFKASRLFGQICLGLGYVHGKGVVHRDLKLENVLLDEGCNPKMADFGGPHEQIAQRLRDLKGSLKKLGLKVRALPPFAEKGRTRVRGCGVGALWRTPATGANNQTHFPKTIHVYCLRKVRQHKSGIFGYSNSETILEMVD